MSRTHCTNDEVFLDAGARTSRSGLLYELEWKELEHRFREEANVSLLVRESCPYLMQHQLFSKT